MPHLTRQQEKAMFAKKGNVPTRSSVNPTIRGRIAGFKEKLRLRKEQKGKERIEEEKLAFEREGITARRLVAEAKLETAREKIKLKEIEARRELREIDIARRERKLAPIRKLVAGAIQAGKTVEKATRPRPVRRRKRKRVKEETGFFGI